MVKKVLTATGAILLFAAPALADGNLSLYGSWWQTDDADEVAGGGVSFEWPFGEVLSWELRGTYYQELTNEPLEDLDLEGEDEGIFEDSSLEAIPIETGLRIHFARDAEVWSPYLGVGGSYFSLDSDDGNLDDEFGYYAALGSQFGDGEGADFLVEVQHRWVDGVITDLGDLDDDGIDDDDINIDLAGFVINLGVTWHW